MPTTQTQPNLDAGLYLCHMIARALRGRRADDKPAGVTWADVWQYAKINKVEAIAWMGMPEHPTQPLDDQLAAAWQSAADMTLFRELTFDAERETVLCALEAQGLSTMTLKGPNTCALYPQPGMRSMSDNDILYGFIETTNNGGWRVRDNMRKAGETVVRDVMQQLGYTTAEENYGVISFVKPPVAHFEMFDSVAMPCNAHADYYANPWEKAIQGNHGNMRWRMEDHYLFHIAHMYKHYDESCGCGIRFAIDEWVFLKALGKADWTYIRRELKTMKLTAFEQQVSRVATIAFGKDSVARVLTNDDISQGRVRAGDALSDNDDLVFLGILLNSGIYGNMQFKMQREIAKAQSARGGFGRGTYLRERIFPSYNMLISMYPWVEGKPWLVPFMPFYRLAKGVRHNSGKIAAELRMLFTRK
ncbi:nucleotidyltransferase family protein [Bifidobacterium leontopitheci]|uniref:Uncharacterized protein n=1 Tax=Bifidobacterium leontopitheci TaxID=2650774 RepID=A0A6I1GD62_9BIFI|nr:nucleotidyltransferase family protein [Bifidobacterium leontopitheci]KAB7789593.1 hypothetical protein F7D09_1889 [Bifidobacterium leontopitheci]